MTEKMTFCLIFDFGVSFDTSLNNEKNKKNHII